MKNDIMQSTMKLQSNQVARVAQQVQDNAAFAMQPPSMERFFEAVDLANAAVKRTSAMQRNWFDAWMDWAEYASTLEGADTVPKYFERLNNIALRAEAQWASQANDVSNLAENVYVSYSYWVSQNLPKADD